MKKIDAITIEQSIQKMRAEDKQWMEDTMKLLRGNLTDEERYAYEIELAKVGYMIGADERDERRRQETEQQMEIAERKTEAAERKIEAAERKMKENEQRAKEIEEALSITLTSLLQKGILSDEEIAHTFNVSLEKIQEIKQQINK